MLVLARKIGDSIVIHCDGYEITVTVLSVSESGIVRLGIDAPQEVRVVRSDVANGNGIDTTRN